MLNKLLLTYYIQIYASLIGTRNGYPPLFYDIINVMRCDCNRMHITLQNGGFSFARAIVLYRHLTVYVTETCNLM